MRILALAGFAALSLAVAQARAQSADKHAETAEDWAWAQLRDDRIADFTKREGCNGPLKPYETKGWDNPCRQISPGFLVRILTQREFRDQLPRLRVRLRGAHITGDVNLSDDQIRPEVWLDSSRIEGDLLVADSHWDRLLSLQGSMVAGDLTAWRMRADSNLLLDSDTVIRGAVNLGGARIGGDLQMGSSYFIHGVNADSLTVAGSLSMGNAWFADKVSLLAAKIVGELTTTGSRFEKEFVGNRMVVDSTVFMNHGAFFDGEVNLVGARIDSNLEMDGSTFAGPVYADSLKVRQNLLMRQGAHFHGRLSLVGAEVGGELGMIGSAFDAQVMADSVKIGGDVFMRDGTTFSGPVSLIGAKIAGNLDLRGSVAVGIDLSEADATELLVAGLKWWCEGGQTPNAAAAGSLAGDDELPVFWPLGNRVWQQARCRGGDPADPPKLILRNFHVADFQDNIDAWPADLDLRGFHYDRLGGLGGTGTDDLGKRPPSAWLDWLARDPHFNTQPYTELSTVLAIAGQRDIADGIQFAARNGERREACASGDPLKCAGLTVLWSMAGYGIGSYTFRVIYCVAFFTVLGAAVLCFSPNARRRSLVWRTGASLHRLLPIIELYKEFTDFFDNPPAKGFQSRNLKPWQVFYFAVHAIVGWALGLILLAAMSGITQKG